MDTPRETWDKQAPSPNTRPSSGSVGADPLKVSSLEKDIRETVTLMKVNTDNVLARGDRIEEMELQSEELTIFSQDFRRPSQRSGWGSYLTHCRRHKYVFGIAVVAAITVTCIIILVTKPGDTHANDTSHVGSLVTSTEMTSPSMEMTSPSSVASSTLRTTTTVAPATKPTTTTIITTTIKATMTTATTAATTQPDTVEPTIDASTVKSAGKPGT